MLSSWAKFIPNQAPSATRQGAGNAFALLSLNLLLLAFFIALTSMGEPEERRTRNVLESIQRSFGERREHPQSQIGVSTGGVDQGKVGNRPAFEKALENAFPLVPLAWDQGLGMHYIELRSAEFFYPQGGIRPSAQALVSSIVAQSLASRRSEGQAAISVAFSSFEETSANAAQSLMEALKSEGFPLSALMIESDPDLGEKMRFGVVLGRRAVAAFDGLSQGVVHP